VGNVLRGRGRPKLTGSSGQSRKSPLPAARQAIKPKGQDNVKKLDTIQVNEKGEKIAYFVTKWFSTGKKIYGVYFSREKAEIKAKKWSAHVEVVTF